MSFNRKSKQAYLPNVDKAMFSRKPIRLVVTTNNFHYPSIRVI